MTLEVAAGRKNRPGSRAARVLFGNCGISTAFSRLTFLDTESGEAAFRNLKDDLELRPIYHQLEQRIQAHIFVAFLVYCLHVTRCARLRPLTAGLTPRAVLDKLAATQMLGVHFPTTDGRTLILSRYTEPNADQKLLLRRLGLTLPPQLLLQRLSSRIPLSSGDLQPPSLDSTAISARSPAG